MAAAAAAAAAVGAAAQLLWAHISAAVAGGAAGIARLGQVEAYRSILAVAADGAPRSRAMLLPPAQKHEALMLMKPLVEDWVGRPLEPSSIFGVRVYTRNASFEPHVDRVETHIASAILHVGHDSGGGAAAAGWPLRILDHRGVPHDVALEPGEALLYESARLVHARPEPLHGEWYANVFVHYRPVGWKEQWEAGGGPPSRRQQLDSCVEQYIKANASALVAEHDIFEHVGLPLWPLKTDDDGGNIVELELQAATWSGKRWTVERLRQG